MKQGKAERNAGRKYIDCIHNIQTEMLQTHKAQRISSTLQQLEDEKGSLSVDKFWKLKKKMSSNDRTKSSILVGGTEIWNGPAIIKEYEREFINRLAHKQIRPEFADYEITTRKLLNLYLSESAASRSEPNFTDEETESAIALLSKSKK